MAIVVNPSKTCTFRSRTTHVAVLHHIAGGKLVEVTWGKMGARISFDEDEEGEKKDNWLHVGASWEVYE